MILSEHDKQWKKSQGNRKRNPSPYQNLWKLSKESLKKESEIAKDFNRYFISVGTALASKIPVVTKDVSEYLSQCNASLAHKELSFQEFEKHLRRWNEGRLLMVMILTVTLLMMSTVL